MPRYSNKIESFDAVRVVLDNLLANGKGSVYALPTHAKAVEWRRQAYYFRTLATKQGETQYNRMVLKLIGDCAVMYTEREVEGVMLDASGNEVAIVDKRLEQDIADMMAEWEGDIIDETNS